MRVPSGRRMCWAVSLGTGKAPLSGSVRSSSESVEFTAVGEEGVVEGGGEDNREAKGGINDFGREHGNEGTKTMKM